METPDNKDNAGMSEADRRIAESIAQHVTARLLDVVRDEETAAKIAEVWVGAFDKAIGRGLRRALWYLALAIGGILGAKLGLLDKLLGALK